MGEGWARGYGRKERSREVVPVVEARVSKSLRKDTRPAKGNRRRAQVRSGVGGGRGVASLCSLYPAIKFEEAKWV